MLWARVVRGAASSAKPVRPAAGHALQAGGIEGFEHADEHAARLG